VAGDRAEERIAALDERHVELGGRPGRWHAVAPAAVTRLTLQVAPGRRAFLRVKATDLVGNETKRGFALPRR